MKGRVMAVEIFTDERIKELKNLKLVITVYPSEDDYVSHWYFESNADATDESSLKELYAILCSMSDVEDAVESMFTQLHNKTIGKNQEQEYDEDND